jgi:RHS repeat-associated protein
MNRVLCFIGAFFLLQTFALPVASQWKCGPEEGYTPCPPPPDLRPAPIGPDTGNCPLDSCHDDDGVTRIPPQGHTPPDTDPLDVDDYGDATALGEKYRGRGETPAPGFGSFSDILKSPSDFLAQYTRHAQGSLPKPGVDAVQRAQTAQGSDVFDMSGEEPRNQAQDDASGEIPSDPVDLRRGEFVYEAQDAEIVGGGVEFSFKRMYRSRVNFSGPLGPAWSHNFESRVYAQETVDGCKPEVTVSLGSLKTLKMRAVSGEGAIGSVYQPLDDRGGTYRLLRSGAGDCAWSLDQPDGSTRCFNQHGLLSSIRARTGDGVSVAWTRRALDDDFMSRVAMVNREVAGRTTHRLMFVYGGTTFSQLTSVALLEATSLKTLNTVTYGYDNLGQLQNVSDSSGAKDTYYYSEPVASDADVPLVGLPEYCEAACNGESPEGCDLNIEPPCVEAAALNSQGCVDGCQESCVGGCRRSYALAMEDFIFHPPFLIWWSGEYRDAFGCLQMSGYRWSQDRYQACYDEFHAQWPWNEFLQSCMSAGCVSKCEGTCPTVNEARATCASECVPKCINANADDPQTFIYGVSRDLSHNLLRVTDGAGAQLVENTYGEDPRVPSFDAVVEQFIGESSSEPLRFEYIDLDPPAYVPVSAVTVRAPGCYQESVGRRCEFGSNGTRCCTTECPCYSQSCLQLRFVGTFRLSDATYRNCDFDTDGTRQCCTEECPCSSTEGYCDDSMGVGEVLNAGHCAWRNYECTEQVYERGRSNYQCTPVEDPPTPPNTIARRIPPTLQQRADVADYNPTGLLNICGVSQKPPGLGLDDTWVLLLPFDVLIKVRPGEEVDRNMLLELGPRDIRLLEVTESGRLRPRMEIASGDISISTRNGKVRFAQGESGELSGAQATDFPTRRVLAFAGTANNLTYIGPVTELSALSSGKCNQAFSFKTLSDGTIESDPPGACEGDVSIVPLASFSPSSEPPKLSVFQSGRGRVRMAASRALNAHSWATAVSSVDRAGIDLFGTSVPSSFALPTRVTSVTGAQALLSSLESIAGRASADVRERLQTSVATVRLEGLFNSFGDDAAAIRSISFQIPNIISAIRPGLIIPWLTPDPPELSQACNATAPLPRFDTVARDRATARWATWVDDPNGTRTVAYYNEYGDNIRIAKPALGSVQDFEYDERHNQVGVMRHLPGSLGQFGPAVCRTFNDRHLPETVSVVSESGISIRQCTAWDERGPWVTATTAPIMLRPGFGVPEGEPLTYEPPLLSQTFYDIDGKPWLSKDEAGDETRLFYNSSARLTSVVAPNGTTTLYRDHDPAIGEPRLITEGVGSGRRTTALTYDGWGHVATIDRSGWGPSEIWEWDDRVRLRTHTITTNNGTPSTLSTGYEYLENGRLETITTPTHQTTLDYGIDGQVRRRATKALVASADGEYEERVECFFRHQSPEGATGYFIDPMGVRWETRRDFSTSGTLISVDAVVSSQTISLYDDCASVLEDAQQPQDTTTHAGTTRLDLGGRPTSHTDSAGVTETVRYDILGRPSARVDATGLRTEVRYDARGRVVARVLAPKSVAVPFMVTEPTAGALSVSLTSYENAGQLVRQRTWAKDAQGSLAPASDVTAIAEPKRRRVTTSSLSNAGTVEVESQFDGLGRPVRIEARPSDGQPDVTSISYPNPLTVRTESPGPDGQTIATVQRFYDSGYLHVASVLDADEEIAIETRSYDGFGRVDSVTDEAGVSRFEYDAVGRLVSTSRHAPDGSDALLPSSRSIYGSRGLLRSVYAGERLVSDYEYDAFGRVRNEVRPSSEAEDEEAIRATTYVGLSSKVESVTLPSGRHFEYLYDARGSLAEVIADATNVPELLDRGERPLFVGPRIASIRLTRGVLGHVEYAAVAGDANTAISRKFDGAGRVLSEVPDARPEFGVRSTYGLGGGRSDQWIGSSDAVHIRRKFLADGRIDTISQATEQLVGFGYTGPSAASTMEYGDALTEARQFDGRGRLTAQVLGAQSLSYGYGKDGFVRQIRERASANEAKSLLVELDAAGRIQRELRDVGEDALETLKSGEIENSDFTELDTPDARSWAQYDYDSGNNWTKRVLDTGTSWVPEPDAANAYVAFGDSTARYDADGRLLEADDRSFAYDVWGRVAEVRDIEGPRCVYEHDALGRRYSEDCDGERTYFGWDGQNLVADRVAGNNQVFVTVHSGGLNTPVARVGGGDPQFLIQGHDRSVRAVVDSNGEVVTAYEYTAYGETNVIGSAGSGNRLGYHGHLWDPQTGLYSMRARMYSPEWGRFVTPDPIGVAGGVNLYAFVGNSPLDHWDPFGLDPFPNNSRARDAYRVGGGYVTEAGREVERMWNSDSLGEQALGGVLAVVMSPAFAFEQGLANGLRLPNFGYRYRQTGDSQELISAGYSLFDAASTVLPAVKGVNTALNSGGKALVGMTGSRMLKQSAGAARSLSSKQAFGLIDRLRSKVRGLAPLGDVIPVKGDGKGTVALVEGAAGNAVFGLNSSLLSDGSKNLARQAFAAMKEAGLFKQVRQFGQGASQVLTHAEGHALLRAAERGALGKSVRMFVDRKTCGTCGKYLPELMRFLGIDELEVVMKNGKSLPISLP